MVVVDRRVQLLHPPLTSDNRPTYIHNVLIGEQNIRGAEHKFFTAMIRGTTFTLLVFVAIPFILDVRRVDAPAGVTQEDGHTGFLHFPSAVLAFIFIARRIQPSFFLVGRESNLCVPTNESFSTCWA